MQLLPKGKNQTLLVLDRNKEIFFSYQTPVAGLIDGRFFRTKEKHSQTTERHINRYLDGAQAEQKEQVFFDNLIA
jgi:hypothetical protein